jgi:hypothetical protein
MQGREGVQSTSASRGNAGLPSGQDPGVTRSREDTAPVPAIALSPVRERPRSARGPSGKETMPGWLPSNLSVRPALIVVLVCLVAYTAMPNEGNCDGNLGVINRTP